MISGSIDSYVNLIGMYKTLVGLPIVGGLIEGLFPFSGSVEMLGSSTGIVGSLGEGFELIGS